MRTLTGRLPRAAYGSNCWPDAAEELLLRAVLASSPSAVEAWTRWCTDERLAGIEIGSQRLLPAVYRNLRAHGVADPHMAILAGAYRRAWYRNQVLFDVAARLIERLQDAGVPVLVIKGAALATLHYRDVGVRTMDDVDLLVAPEDARRAIALLEQAGWQPVLTPVPRHLVAVRGAWHYRGPNGEVVDLHWRAFEHSRFDELDLWEAAVPLDLARTRTGALAPEDELLLTCAHGVGWNPISPLRWVADAATIVRRAGPSLDWDRAIRLTERHRLAFSVSQLLAYLQREFVPEIPVAVIERFSSTEVDRGARARHQARLAPSPLGNVRLHRAAYRARRATPVVGEPRLGFLDFMVQRWSLAGRGDLFGFVARKCRPQLPARRARGAEQTRRAANS